MNKSGHVISIENMAFARGSRAAFFSGHQMNQPNSPSDQLVLINLALHTPGKPDRVVALLVAKTQFGLDLLLADDNRSLCSYSMPATKEGGAPAHYRLTNIGPINEFLLRYKQEYEQVLMEDSKMEHGQLTIARAVYAMSTSRLSAGAALLHAIEESIACRTLIDSISEQAGEVRRST